MPQPSARMIRRRKVRSPDTGQKIFRIKPEKWLQDESEARSWISESPEECYNHAFNVTTLVIIFDRKISDFYTIVNKQIHCPSP
jgi:hypothetical protein